MLTERRQTMMFSATTTEKTQALTKLALKKQPVYIGVDDTKESATVDGLEQGETTFAKWKSHTIQELRPIFKNFLS